MTDQDRESPVVDSLEGGMEERKDLDSLLKEAASGDEGRRGAEFEGTLGHFAGALSVDTKTPSDLPAPSAGDPAENERLRREVHARLEQHTNLNAEGIRVEVRDGVVFLTGTVENRYAKESADIAAREVADVRGVENRLHVQPHEPGGPTLTAREEGTDLQGTTQRS